jgi:hypothetical protein
MSPRSGWHSNDFHSSGHCLRYATSSGYGLPLEMLATSACLLIQRFTTESAALGAGQVLAAYVNGFGTDPLIGSPTPAQVTGTWVGSSGARLVLRPDGTFTASHLPPYVGQPTASPTCGWGAIRPLATAHG